MLNAVNWPMKITSVQAFLLTYPFPDPLHLSYYGGKRTIFKRDAMLIRIETDNGLVGYAPGQGSQSAKELIDATIGPWLTGRNLGDADALRVMFQAGPGEDAPVLKAYCTVEIALYDLLGKSKGLPVSELIGGRVRDRIRLYGSAGMYMSPEGYAAEASAITALGFRAYKMRTALGPEDDIRTVKLMREAVGPSIDLMIDAHSWWRMGDHSYDEAAVEKAAAQMAEYDIAWLEEPLPPDDHAAYARLSEANLVSLASGEHEPDEGRFLDLIFNTGVEYIQMDVVCQGGYPLARKILPEILNAERKFAFHSWGTDLEVIAAAHLGICWPETTVEWLEYPVYSTPTLKTMYAFPLAADILKQPLQISDGELSVPRTGGLGVEVDETVIEKYPWVPGPWSSFTTDSPARTFHVSGDHTVRWTDQ